MVFFSRDRRLSLKKKEIQYPAFCCPNVLLTAGIPFEQGWGEYSFLISFFFPTLQERMRTSEKNLHLQLALSMKRSCQKYYFAMEDLQIKLAWDSALLALK